MVRLERQTNGEGKGQNEADCKRPEACARSDSSHCRELSSTASVACGKGECRRQERTDGGQKDDATRSINDERPRKRWIGDGKTMTPNAGGQRLKVSVHYSATTMGLECAATASWVKCIYGGCDWGIAESPQKD